MAAFLRSGGLPPAKLRAGKRHDGNDQHNERRFSHLCSRCSVTTDKKPRQKNHRRYKNNDREEDPYSHIITCFGFCNAVECTGLIHSEKARFAFSFLLLIHRDVRGA